VSREGVKLLFTAAAAASCLMPSLLDNECWTLLLDFTNEFNSTSGEAVLVEFRPTCLVSLHGWSPVILVYLSSFWIMTFTAAVVSSRGIH